MNRDNGLNVKSPITISKSTARVSAPKASSNTPSAKVAKYTSSKRKGRKSKSNKPQNIANRYNARLRAIKKEFGEEYLKKEVIDKLKDDPNLVFTKSGMISAKKSIIDEDVAGYLDQSIPTADDIVKKYMNGEDARITKALEGIEDIAEIKSIIGKQVSAMYNVSGKFESSRDNYYEVVQMINNTDLSDVDNIMVDPLDPPKKNSKLEAKYDEFVRRQQQIYLEKAKVTDKLYAKGIKTYDFLDNLMKELDQFIADFEAYQEEVVVYNKEVNAYL